MKIAVAGGTGVVGRHVVRELESRGHEPVVLLQACGRRRLVLPIRLPGQAGRAMAEGLLLPTDDGARGTLTFDQWLASEDANHWL